LADRITQESVEFAVLPTTNSRITQEFAEVATRATLRSLVTQVVAEVGYPAIPVARVTLETVEVVYNPLPAVPSPTDLLFPPDISRGARGGPAFLTSITVASSGREQRVQQRINPRRSWDVSHALRDEDMSQVLLSFFLNVQGRTTGFRFRDPLDHAIPVDAPEPTAQVNPTTFQIRKTYVFGPVSVTRDITRPEVGTAKVFHGTTPVPPNLYVVDYTTGLILFASATGYVPNASCVFDVFCRFDVDSFSMTYDDVDVRTWDQIPIVELFE
jgi:uncharacterized protein (TIGR02217 family)